MAKNKGMVLEIIQNVMLMEISVYNYQRFSLEMHFLKLTLMWMSDKLLTCNSRRVHEIATHTEHESVTQCDFSVFR
jgi:hypothetical protein